jgi:hypothetical protein
MGCFEDFMEFREQVEKVQKEKKDSHLDQPADREFS